MISFAGLRRTSTFVVTLIAALALWAAPASAVAPPKVMVALGDSITRGFNSDGPGCPTGPSLDCAKNSWSTGTNPAVNSQFQRIEAIDPGRNPIAINDAISGATARPKLNAAGQEIGLVAQAEKAATQDPEYVTIEIGANDACTGSLATQTPTGDFRGYVKTALTDLVSADPKVYIQIASIPDINKLYTLFSSDPNAILRWSPQVFNVCQALLANAPSDAPADVARRDAFRQQVKDYNAALAGVCAEFKRCLFDNDAVFNSGFTAADVATVTNTGGLNIPPFNAIPIIPVPGAIPNSTADYFHPSLLGQASLAETTWNASFFLMN